MPSLKTQYLLILLTVWLSYHRATCQSCFASICQSKYAGVKDGGRCFYMPGQNATWQNAWSLCASNGGTLAQLHTSSEYNAATNKYMNIFWDTPIFIGALVNTIIVDPAMYINSTKFQWYTGPSTTDPKFNGVNTWIRTRATDDRRAENDLCMGIYIFVWPGTNYTNTGDFLCNVPGYVLCVATSTEQTYTYYANSCLTETIMDTYQVSTVDDCANMCSSKSLWCRSFNFWNTTCGTRTCDLFSWTVNDNPGKAALKGCFHYSYDP